MRKERDPPFRQLLLPTWDTHWTVIHSFIHSLIERSFKPLVWMAGVTSLARLNIPYQILKVTFTTDANTSIPSCCVCCPTFMFTQSALFFREESMCNPVYSKTHKTLDQTHLTYWLLTYVITYDDRHLFQPPLINGAFNMWGGTELTIYTSPLERTWSGQSIASKPRFTAKLMNCFAPISFYYFLSVFVPPD